MLEDMGSKYLGLDVLPVDSCCAGIAGQGGKAKGTNVVLMAHARVSAIRERMDGQLRSTDVKSLPGVWR
jgi:hypothetical protein